MQHGLREHQSSSSQTTVRYTMPRYATCSRCHQPRELKDKSHNSHRDLAGPMCHE